MDRARTHVKHRKSGVAGTVIAAQIDRTDYAGGLSQNETVRLLPGTV